MTDHITIPLDVAEAAAEALGNFVSDYGWSDSDMQAMDNLDAYIARHRANQAARAELAKPVEQVKKNWNRAIRDSVDALLAEAGYEPDSSARHLLAMMNFDKEAQTTPAWHDAPEVVALKADRDAMLKDAERFRWLAANARSTSEHWGGRWSLIIDGPAPKRHDCEDALYEAIDAAVAKAEGEKS